MTVEQLYLISLWHWSLFSSYYCENAIILQNIQQ